MNKNNIVGVIYAGGTFGSYGKPLASLSPDIFLPILSNILQTKFEYQALEILPNHVVKDSSQLSSSNFSHFYRLIVETMANYGIRQFVILTGTDTLSYLSAFLAESLAESDVCVVVTGAMQPLLDSNILTDYVINPDSDASQNLFGACMLACQGASGVQVFFGNEHWSAQTVQKIHSHDMLAFVGHHQVGYPATSYLKSMLDTTKQQWLENRLANLDVVCQNLSNVQIATLYLTPMSGEQLAKIIEKTLENQPQAIILMGFGSGNVPHSVEVEKVLQLAKQNNCLVIISTQCPYGGVSDTYQAGAWLANYEVLSSGKLTLPAIFARLLWICANYQTVNQRQQRWLSCLNY